MTIVMICLAVLGGALLSIQAAINGQLGGKVGVFRCDFLTFVLGAVVTALLIFFFEPPHTLCGVPYIVIMAVQRIGTAVTTVAVIFGQLAMSMLIDNFGWLGNAAIAFSPGRLPGRGAVLYLQQQPPE
ncbi:DMT family transporter [Candidatus Pantoea persica]|uniref:DMT family transporter n=1 Tax=Candidatus Pantoea persica TaxID=2518128 RepID=UPI0035A931CA|nr:membrane protein [Candidatus Pantoea persica]